MRQALVTELRAVRDDDHLFGHLDHGPLGFDQQQVAVVEAPLVDPCDAHYQLADAEFGEHFVGVRPQRHARPRVDVAAEQH
jgi:hypothetical protein